MSNVATGLQFWTEPDNDWDKLVLGGVVWPGVISDISGDAVARNLDIKKSKGSDNATITDEGNTNAKFSVTLTIWTDAQWRELQERIPEVHPRRKGGERKPLQIINPQLNLLGINEAYLISIPIPKLDRFKGGPLDFTMGFLEWVPNPKPVKVNTGGSGKVNNNANQGDEVERQLTDEELRILEANALGISVDELTGWQEGGNST